MEVLAKIEHPRLVTDGEKEFQKRGSIGEL